MYANVVLDVPLAKAFDYHAPELTHADIGRRVLVPFGNKLRVGLVVGVSSQPEYASERIKALSAVLTDMPPLGEDLLQLFRFCSNYYQHPLGQVVFTALPGRLRDPKPFATRERWRYQLQSVQALIAQLPARAILQHRLASLLTEPRSEAEIRQISPGAWKIVREWLAAGWVTTVTEAPVSVSAEAGKPLNAEQQAAVAEIAAIRGFQPFLLFGITGSGKTEVYLEAIANVLRQGRQALVLVPEINLTPQLQSRFAGRFPGVNLVNLHSSVADAERAANWLQAARGEAAIVLGTRLSVFAPMPKLGIIVVDEEHDSSFKQQDGLRYSARDLAVWRAHQRQVPIVLGSATPSLESWYNAQNGRYRRLDLHQRAVAGAQPPNVRLISTKHVELQDGLHPFVWSELSERLSRREQVLVFVNRRGYSPVLFCGECGWMATCTQCTARMTVHLSERRLRCHYCGADSAIPRACPGCGNADLHPLGHGTQRLEAALSSRFPHARVLRVDRDTTRQKGSFESALDAVHGGKVDILVGTQMLAKGHDFPRLSLVVVVNADAGLYSADYRAAERLYAQLVQVSGRAGRAQISGDVLVQTDFAEHPLYAALVAQDFPAFADFQLADRRVAGFPPFRHQAVLRAEAAKLEIAMQFLQEATALAPDVSGVTIYDPVPASLTRLAGMERAHILIQSASRPALQNLLTTWQTSLRDIKTRQLRWALDVDPQEF